MNKKIYVKDKKSLKFMKDRENSMKKIRKIFNPEIDYDKDYDSLFISFRGIGKYERNYEHTVEITDDIRFDFDKKDNIIGIEIDDLQDKLKEKKHD